MPTDLPTSPPTSTYPTTQPSTTAGAIPPDTESTPAHPTLSISVSSQPTGGSMPTAVVDGSNSNEGSGDDNPSVVAIAAAFGVFAGVVFVGVLFVIIRLVWNRQQRQGVPNGNTVITYQPGNSESMTYCDIDSRAASTVWTTANAQPVTIVKPYWRNENHTRFPTAAMATEAYEIPNCCHGNRNIRDSQLLSWQRKQTKFPTVDMATETYQIPNCCHGNRNAPQSTAE